MLIDPYLFSEWIFERWGPDAGFEYDEFSKEDDLTLTRAFILCPCQDFMDEFLGKRLATTSISSTELWEIMEQMIDHFAPKDFPPISSMSEVLNLPPGQEAIKEHLIRVSMQARWWSAYNALIFWTAESKNTILGNTETDVKRLVGFILSNLVMIQIWSYESYGCVEDDDTFLIAMTMYGESTIRSFERRVDEIVASKSI